MNCAVACSRLTAHPFSKPWITSHAAQDKKEWGCSVPAISNNNPRPRSQAKEPYLSRVVRILLYALCGLAISHFDLFGLASTGNRAAERIFFVISAAFNNPPPTKTSFPSSRWTMKVCALLARPNGP